MVVEKDNIGDRIKAYRKQNNLSMPALEKILGIPKDRIYKWEKGTVPYDTADYEKVEKLLNGKIGKVEKQTNSPHLIPYYDVAVSAGVMLGINGDKIKPDAEISVPGLNDCDLAVNVWGDSMYPKYCSGEIVVCKSVPLDTALTYVRFGEAYVIMCDDGPVVKYIKKGKDDKHLSFESENEHYESYQVNKNRIQSLYLVKGVITRKNF